MLKNLALTKKDFFMLPLLIMPMVSLLVFYYLYGDKSLIVEPILFVLLLLAVACGGLRLLFLGLIAFHKKRKIGKKLEDTSFYLAYLGLFGLTLILCVDVPRRGGTDALIGAAYFYLPFYAGACMIIGYIIGWVIELLFNLKFPDYRR